MRFSFPLFPAEFEIPDEWWTEAGMAGFTATRSAYCSTVEARLILLRDIESPFRFPECSKDFHGFDRARLISVLNGIATETEIEPVPLIELPKVEFVPAPYRYRVLNGFHRFYASVAAGFEYLPTIIR